MSTLTPEQWDRFVFVFNRARSAPVAERDAIVLGFADGDDALAAAVLALLEREDALSKDATGGGGLLTIDEARGAGGNGPAADNPVAVEPALAAGHETSVTANIDQRADDLDHRLDEGVGSTLIQDALHSVAGDLSLGEAAQTSGGSSYDADLDDRLPPGTQVGAYTIERVIDAGGMGIVYEARQARPDRLVALKVMRLGLPSRSAMRRFAYESEILAHLQHANIAQVFEAGMHFEASVRTGGRGIPYFAMELIPEARTITEYADRGNLSNRERVALFLQVCDAVQHGHQKGIIHRDLKPSNILVDGAGTAKVIDFGVAKATESDIALTSIETRVGALIGTVQYMSPEQCSGDWGEVDTRSDVYALGVILYELLCRVPPYEVSTTNLMRATRAVCEAVVRRPREIKPEVRGGLEAVVLKAVERDSTRRYANAGELADDLRRWLAGDPVEARDHTVWMQSVRWARRRPLAITTAACLLIVLAIFGGSAVGAWWIGMRPTRLQAVGDPPNQFVQVVAANGSVVHEWRGVQRVANYDLYRTGDQRGAMVWWSINADDRRQGTIDLYDIRRPDRPLATLRKPTRPDNWPAEWLKVLGTDGRGESFNLSFGTQPVADIFPELPGDELIIVAKHDPQFPTRIAIHDARGRLVYSRWHAGHITDVVWLPAKQLLVMTGSRNQLWLEPPVSPGMTSPEIASRIITAIEPEIGGTSDGMVLWRGGRPQERVAWYRYLHPRRQAYIFFRSFLSRQHSADGDEYARLVLQMEAGEMRSGTRMIVLAIDARSGEILRTVESNEYSTSVERMDERTGVRIPRASVFQLPPYPHGLVFHRRDENGVPYPVEEWPMGATEPRPFVWTTTTDSAEPPDRSVTATTPSP